jgi:hypothetical protein
MPHPAHLIVAGRCQFRLATYIPASKVIVSTVGEYKVRDTDKAWEIIGAGRLYETFVFPAKKSGDCPACLYSPSDFAEIDTEAANTAADAYSAHIAMCKKWDHKKAVPRG